ncbi:XK-related protein 8-like [Sinocyclocheilus grahami]|uniref:XK-related protein 8-like n=1 Tax=Sinocyclocheilus grahami TaxID=75366 RepID=UPI0007AC7F9D|nr:PREDICTED: XK-related protein 8-like [Sinocyclocheilus grahami]
MVETRESFPFGCLLKYLFTLVGLLLFLLDIVLDIWTVVSFYQDGAYVYMAVMIFLLLGSSVLLQVFSWLWYSDSLEKIESKVEKFADRHLLIKPFHFLQLGIYLRYAGVIETSTTDFLHRINNFRKGVCHSIRDDVAVKLKHDFLMLRLFETFSENTPQLTLILSRILQREELELITGLKILTSAAGIAFSVALYHRSMHVYGSQGRKMSWISTGVYFLWNLLLIIPRVTALALFCSVLPCYIIAHFLSLWMLLVFVAWSQKTGHMKSPGWEWLFRAAVGLIWYFSWFNVSKKGSIKVKMVLYYIFMALDTMMLLGFWCRKVFEYAGCWSSLNPCIVIPTLLGLYVIGILVQMIYYRWFHPKIAEPGEGQFRQAATYDTDLTDSTVSSLEDIAAAPVQPLTGVLKRSRTMADNFYF